jgi:hypothetical protein
MYPDQELADMHFLYGLAGGNSVVARRLYQGRHPGRRCPDRKSFVSICLRLREHGNFAPRVADRGQPKFTIPEVEEDILDVVNETRGIGMERVSIQVGVGRSPDCLESVARQTALPSAVCTGLVTTRLRCTRNVLPVVLTTNPNFPAFVIFTDKAQFTKDGIQNFNNQHMWADENPHAILPLHHQQRFSFNMWSGICGDSLFGSHVFPQAYRRSYKAFLGNNKPDFLADVPLIIHRELHFMHDGAPAYFSLARRYLNQKFPGRMRNSCLKL